MKIKQVEIDSFRLFDDEKIPFVNPHHQDECANLVAIHAPNGFGKTSLFDAIEFCVTNNIQRLKHVNSFKEDVKSDQAQNDFSSFIHNKDNPDKEIGIKITYEDGTRKERKVSPDDEMKLLKGDPENGYFSEVMLSQDWFTRFLSANDATQRFEIFTKNFEDTNGLLEYYEQMKTAHRVLRNQIADRNKKIATEKKELKEKIDEKIVEHLSETVEKMAEAGVEIRWNRTISDKQIEDLSLQGEQRRFETDEELKNSRAVVGKIEKAKSGQDGLIGLGELAAVLSQIAKLVRKSKEIQAKLQKIQTLKTLIETIGKLNAELVKCEGVRKELDFLIQRYPAYKKIAEEIIEETRQRDIKVNEQELLNGKISAKGQELNDVQDQHGNQTKERDGWKNKKESLKDEYAKYQALLTQIKKSNEDEQKENQKLSQLAPKIEEQEKESQRLASMYTIVHRGAVTIELDDYKEESKRIIALARTKKEKTALADKLGQTIQEQQRYMGQVEALVVSAREMAVTLKSGVCPLCGQNHGQVDSLLAAIEGNKSISKSIEDTIKLKVETEQEIEKLKQESNNQYRQLEDKLQERITIANAAIEKLKDEKKEIDEAIAKTRQIRQATVEMISMKYSQFENLTEAQVLAIYEERLQQAEKQLAEAAKRKDEIAAALNKLRTDHQQLTQQIDGMNKALLAKQNQLDYADYQRKLNERGEKDATLELWQQQYDEINKAIASYKEKITTAGEDKINMEENGVLLTEETVLTAQSVNYSTVKNALETQYFKTIQFVKEDCKVKNVETETTPDIILQEVEKTKKHYVELIDVCENRSRLLAAYMNLLKSAEQYNGQQKTKKRIEDYEKQIGRLEKRQEDIDTEIEKLKSYLEEFVQSYFQLDLINRLYNTIDPHPSYKKVRFECDFNQKKPKLLVIMESVKDGNDKIVPNLYLSTAQINILSFCIFMAKAMFAKSDDGKALDCIFVDDPIQALDDINILSMIDLLRNVAFTLNKQIVITTHDQNFFNLLQKKMPQDKFNACYLQLKERGKFKVQREDL